MNLDLFKELLIGKTADRFSWDERNGNGNNVALRTTFNLRPYDDDILLDVDFNEDGELFVEYTFDTAEYNAAVLKLINNFNLRVPFFKAYLEKGRRAYYLKVVYSSPHCNSIEDACNCVLFSLDLLKEDDVVRYLQPLTVITEG